MLKQPVVTHNELVSLVADSCGYFKYEVEDVLTSLARVLSERIKEGHDIKLEGIGEFSRKVSKQRMFRSSFTGQYHNVDTKVSISLKPDGCLKRALNETNSK